LVVASVLQLLLVLQRLRQTQDLSRISHRSSSVTHAVLLRGVEASVGGRR